MACAISIRPSDNRLQINNDDYDLNKIKGVEVRALTWKDHLRKMMLLGLVTSSVLFYFIPTEEQAKSALLVFFLPMVGFLAGALMALISSAKYEFRVEFAHTDETGVQWITVAKSRHAADYSMFKERAAELGEYIQ
ncbi:hypothetical protein [Aeromonas tecta]|uniref:hypothetical protein n=1 Tax=Aeromonas tecta TaxID=324617 RepID=UPI0018DC5E32|nr:hypothetical protein [Aeromonas tecta]